MNESESMSATSRVAITRLPTGVPGLDEVLGGGLPEYSFTVIAGAPGAGKTTLAHQILFTLASPARPALYFSVMGKPTLKWPSTPCLASSWRWRRTSGRTSASRCTGWWGR